MEKNSATNNKNLRFDKYDNCIFEKKEKLMDEGKTNIGYTLEESIMEAIDNSLDVKTDRIYIKLFIEIFTEFKQISKDNSDVSMVSNRGSYIVVDNGAGIENIEEVFNFGESKKIKYYNREEYLSKNGRFRYGLISHFNVGSQVILYSKTKNDTEWKYIVGNYNRYTNCLYVSKTDYMTKEDKAMLEAMGIILPNNTGTILYVRGIRKTELDFANIDNFIGNLIQQIGMTYYDNLCEKCNITINNISALPLNPLGEDLVDELIKPTIFAKYKISLNEILMKLDDNIVKEELISRFINIFESKDQLLSETIKIKLVSINKNLGNKNPNLPIVKEKFNNLNKIYFPSVEYRGFYIKRNKRYIGKSLSMIGIVLDHSKYNRFRGEISFNPIFDDFFKIQINKNQNTLSEILRCFIEEKILNDINLQGNSAAKRIENAINEKKSPKNALEDRITELKIKARKISTELNTYCQDNNEVEETITLLQNQHLGEDEFLKIQQKLVQIHTAYKQRYRDIYHDAKLLIDRINSKRKRKLLMNVDEEIQYAHLFSLLVEPIQENEFYGIFYLVYILFQHKFEFRLVDYNTEDGIDCVIKISSELFAELNFKERFGNQADIVKEEIQALKFELYTNGDDEQFCYLELKLKLADTINHSLALVSHIICWEKSKSDQIQADDDLYGFTDSNKTLLINSGNEIIKKVKVIYIKDMIENITGGKFYK